MDRGGMANRGGGDRFGSLAGEPNRQMGLAFSNQGNNRSDNRYDNQGAFGQGASTGRGRGGRPRRTRYSRYRGNPGGRTGSGRRDREVLPTTAVGWQQKIQSEGHEAFLDFSLCLQGTPIQFTEQMGEDLVTPGLVAGQETQAFMLACCTSMQTGRAFEPDGSQGVKIGSHVLEYEAARAESGG